MLLSLQFRDAIVAAVGVTARECIDSEIQGAVMSFNELAVFDESCISLLLLESITRQGEGVLESLAASETVSAIDGGSVTPTSPLVKFVKVAAGDVVMPRRAFASSANFSRSFIEAGVVTVLLKLVLELAFVKSSVFVVELDFLLFLRFLSPIT